jgi:hypothetical protein
MTEAPGRGEAVLSFTMPVIALDPLWAISAPGARTAATMAAIRADRPNPMNALLQDISMT